MKLAFHINAAVLDYTRNFVGTQKHVGENMK